jgi:hypothetical protein
VTRLFDRTLDTLEERGLARAASPYRLTEVGKRARLAGLGAHSCVRLREATSNWPTGLLGDLAGIELLHEEATDVIASTLFEAEEVLEGGLWFRRTATSEADRVAVIRSLRSGKRFWPYDDALFASDTTILSAWISGAGFEELGAIPPVFRRGLFGGSNTGERAADAAELLGRLSYPAAWTWSAVTAMLGQQGEVLPHWLRRAIEYGVPGRVGVELIERVALTRAGAVAVGSVLSDSWEVAVDELLDLVPEDVGSWQLSETDAERLFEWREGL